MMSHAYRPIDLARATGIDPIEVRALEYAAVIPPAARTPSGHRRYGERHLAALRTVQALAQTFGRPLGYAIMRDYHEGRPLAAYAAIHAQHSDLARRHTLHREILDLLHTWSASTEADEPSVHIGTAAARLDIPATTLRFWEDAGILQPPRDATNTYRLYDAVTLHAARLVLLLRRQGQPLPAIVTIIARLGRTPSPALIATIGDEIGAHLLTQSQRCTHATALFWRYVTAED